MCQEGVAQRNNDGQVGHRSRLAISGRLSGPNKVNGNYTIRASSPPVRAQAATVRGTDRQFVGTPAASARPQADGVHRDAPEVYAFGPVGFITFDQSARILEVDRAACEMLELKPTQLVGLPLTTLVPLSRLTDFLDHLRRCRSMSGERVTSELEFLKASGGTLPVELVSVPTAGGARVFPTAILDLTDRRKAERASRVAREVAESIVESVPHPLLHVDRHLTVIRVNAAFCQKFRTNALEVVGHPLPKLPCVQMQTDVTSVLKKLFVVSGPIEEVAVTARETASGRELQLVVSGRRLDCPHQSGASAIISLRDITAQLAAEAKTAHLLAEIKANSMALETAVRVRTAELAAAHDMLRDLSAKLVEAQELERRHIARELHDDVGQELTAVKMSLNNARAKLPKGAAPVLDEAIDSVGGLLDKIRRMAFELRPPALDDIGLVAALRNQVTHFGARTGVKVEFKEEGLDEAQLRSAHKTALFRIAQEALTNVARHAGVRKARLHLRQCGALVILEVTDGGKGFEGSPQTTLGLAGMRERAASLNGQVHVYSKRGKGTRVEVKLPIQPGKD
ncbi:MAG TPA: PAS domain S-box protein [Methylomirabilota bacterium]|nr:PAS domain S-box protein [Methylomirabilota bacterium]